jgi:hypothetical protein
MGKMCKGQLVACAVLCGGWKVGELREWGVWRV